MVYYILSCPRVHASHRSHCLLAEQNQSQGTDPKSSKHSQMKSSFLVSTPAIFWVVESSGAAFKATDSNTDI